MANATNSGTVTPDYIFSDTVSVRDITKFTLMRGVTDYTALQQFDLYETGYSFLINLQIPGFLDKLQALSSSGNGGSAEGYAALISNYRHILEYDFRGAQGIEDITSETSALTNGIDDLQMITKVREQAASQFTMQYFERSGSVITKTHEAFLRGIKDPRTQFKRYLGLIDGPTTVATGSEMSKTPVIDKGFHNEVFHFLLIVTDNTGFNVEKAYILASCQPSAANTSIYNVTRGEIQFSELSVSFNGFPVSGKVVNSRAAKFLQWINDNTCFDEMQFGYQVLSPDRTKAVLGDGWESKQNFKDSQTITKSPTLDDFDPNSAFNTGESNNGGRAVTV